MALNIIGGKYRGKKIHSPPDKSGSRPTSGLLRGALFDQVRSRLPGKSFLDLFSGTGSVGLDAMSQGAGKVSLVENNPSVLKILEKNVRMFDSENLTVCPAEALDYCRQCRHSNHYFDILFADPPFELDFTPFLSQFQAILAPGGALYFQHPTRNPPVWITEADEVKKYGESSLAIFYN